MDSGFSDCDVALRDGRSVRLRAMRPSDEAELVQTFGRMSDDARYMRFMRVVREPNLERVRQVLASFPGNGFGIVATIPAADGVDIVGSTPKEFEAYIQSEIPKWAAVVKASGARLE